MSLEMRLIRPDEYGEAHALWNECFPEDADGFSDYYFERRTDYTRILAAFVDGKMASDLHMLPYPLDFFGRRRECCMVAGVATLIEYRKRGISTALLRAADDIMRERGCLAAVLQPFETPFYEKAGYLPFARLTEFRASGADMGQCRAAALHCPDAAELLRIYDAYKRGFTGMMARDALYMEEMLVEQARTGGSVVSSGEAYAVYSADNGKAHVYECAGENIESVVAALCGEYESVECALPRGTARFLENGEEWIFNMIKPLDVSFFEGLPVKSIEEIVSGGALAPLSLEYY